MIKAVTDVYDVYYSSTAGIENAFRFLKRRTLRCITDISKV